MNSIILKENLKIEDMIYEIRGKQVMLDSDLANLYQCKNGTKEINQAVKNNPDKFPERFAFRISDKEYNILKSNFLTSKGGSRKGHNAFTEQGVYMLATILKSPKATQITLNIMDAFVIMRHYIGSNLLIQNSINNMVIKHDNEIKESRENIKLLQETFNRFIKPEENNKIFFKGQIYDAYSLLIDIFNKAKKEIIIIDNYIDKSLLDILSKIKKKVKIITNKYNNHDYEKYKEQYNNVKLIINNDIHDRFIIIDKKTLYHSGASFKDLGKKCFEISRIEDSDILCNLLKKL